MRFGEFDVDPEAGELRKSGVRVKLQDLPFRLLVVLLRRPGTVVTREDLRRELWGTDTFVDAEAGLNTAIAKLREALGDSAETPAFIETLPKRGYRFVGTIVPDLLPEADTDAIHIPLGYSRRAWVFAIAGIALSVLAFAAYRTTLAPARSTIAVVRFHNETGIADHDRLAGSLTDAVVVSLARDPRYAVIGNSPVLRTERIFEDVKRIGTTLAADYVVLGQLQNGDRGLVARAHFVRVSDLTHLWAGKIDLAVPDPEQAVTTAVAAGLDGAWTR
jgi:DNA-binding winged helix-turn-helix (wHTH) protein/TolB-like protein